MFPSKLARRAGILSGVATGTFMIAMAATPAYAIGPPALGVGSACPIPSLSSLIPTGLECVNGVLVTIISQQPVPIPAPKTSVPATGPLPTPAPNPLGGLVGGVTGTVTKTVTGTVTGTLGGGGTTVPGVPGAPVTGPTSIPTQGSTGAVNGGTSSQPGTTTPAGSSNTSAPSDGSSLLGPAAAFLPGAGIANFADLGSLSPLADSIPSPLLAAPETRLAAVQAPLIAAGNRASTQADSLFSRFGSKALPGILVILATALVAAVGAGNLRAWQARLAAKRAS
jgi:hypothetical protein